MDLLAVVVIDAPLYDELFGALVTDNAEGLVLTPLPFDEAAVKELLTQAPLQAAASALSSPWRTRTGMCCSTADNPPSPTLRSAVAAARCGPRAGALRDRGPLCTRGCTQRSTISG